MGLGAAPTTLALMDTDAVAEALSLPDTMAAYCLIPVGYPLGNLVLLLENLLRKLLVLINGADDEPRVLFP